MTTSMAEEIDLTELRSSTQRLLADKLDRRAPWDGSGRQTAKLDASAAEQGWFLLTVPEEMGGLGQSFAALAPIYEELGRSLAPFWFSGTMAAVDALLADGSEAAGAVVAEVLDNRARIALVTLPAGVSEQPTVLPMVPADDGATHVLLLADDGSSARLVATNDPSLVIQPVDTWDLGRAYVEIRLQNDGAGLALSQEAAFTARAHAELALALDCVGAASQCLLEAVDYMLGRQQFGRSIASFQALKHRAADHKVAIELARSLADQATNMFAARSGNWALLATQAKVLAVQAFRQVAEDGVQLHGGVGFTWEYNCHLFLKRALVNELLYGTPEHLANRIAAQIG